MLMSKEVLLSRKKHHDRRIRRLLYSLPRSFAYLHTTGSICCVMFMIASVTLYLIALLQVCGAGENTSSTDVQSKFPL